MSEPPDGLEWDQLPSALVDPRRGLWQLVPAPAVAALHFLVCFFGTSVYCMRAPGGDLALVRVVLAVVSAVLLVLVGWIALVAWRRWRLVRRPPLGSGARGEEVEFLARITFYLATLSGIGMAFVATPLAFIRTCL